MANVKNFGLVGVGTTVQYGKGGPSLAAQSSTVLQATGTAAFIVPTGTTGQRPTAATGMIRLNNDSTPVVEYYNGTTWTTLATGGTAVTSVSGTTDRITSTGGTTPVIDIAATYVGQTSITTLGTVTTGTWNGTTIAVANGGTGATTLTGYVKGNGTSPFTASATVPTSDLSGTIDLTSQVSGVLPPANGGTGVANDPGDTITLGGAVSTGGTLTTGGNFTTVGSDAMSITVASGGSSVTLPSSGTLISDATIAANAVTSFQTSLSGLTPSAATNGVVTLAGTLGPTSGGTGLATFSAGDVLYASAGNVWSAAPAGFTSGVQAWDAALDALAAKTTTGILVQTAADTYASRTLQQPAAGITISNADGVSGDPTFALANDLAALEGLTTTGYIVRTADGAATTRTITGTAGNIDVTNGAGVTSDTTINLATVSQAATGDFVKVTLDGFGRVTGNTPVVTADITALVDGTYVNTSGDTMTGTLNMGTFFVTMDNPPTTDTQAANKAYVDSVATGLSWKDPVQAATTANLPYPYDNGTGGVGATITVGTSGLTIDGVVLANGNRVLVKDQANGAIVATDGLVGGTGYTANLTGAGPYALDGTGTGATATFDTSAGGVVTAITIVNPGTGYSDNETLTSSAFDGAEGGTGFSADVNGVTSTAQNGIYVVSGIGSSVVLTRAVNMDAPGEFYGAAVLVTNGTLNDNSGWTQTEIVSTVGTDPVLWAQFSGGNTYTWGTGLANSGNTVFVNLGAGISELPNDEVGIDLYGSATSALILTLDGTTRDNSGPGPTAGAKLALLTGAGLTQDATGLYIDSASVTNAMLVNDFITINGDSGTPDPVALGETLQIIGTSVQGISTTIGTNTLTITAANASSSQKGVASFTTTEFVVTDGNVALGLVPVTKGGTGLTSYTVGDLLYADSTTSLASLAVGTSTQVLKGGTTPGWGSVVLTTDVSGILPPANGGTGVNNGTNTLTLGGNLTTSGAFDSTFTMTGTTTVTFPTSGTLATVGGTVSSFSGGTTGLTPNTPTTGAVVLGGTLVVANGGTGVSTLGANQVMIGNGTGAVLTSSALSFVTDTLTVGTATLQGAAGGDVTLSATTGNGDINLVPNGTGAVIIGPAGAGLIQSDAANTLTVSGDTGLTLTAATSGAVDITTAAGDINMNLPASTTYKVSVVGPSDAQYISGLANNDLVTKYYVDTIAGSSQGDVKAVQGTVDLTSATSQNIGAALPAGVTILSVKMNVTVASDAATTVQVGKSGGAEYMTTSENDPEVTGLYLAETFVNEAGAVQVQATVATAGTVGSATVIVTYQIN